jgi:hypothetical protein
LNHFHKKIASFFEAMDKTPTVFSNRFPTQGLPNLRRIPRSGSKGVSQAAPIALAAATPSELNVL